MSNKSKMYDSNKLAREYLLQNGFDYIYLKPHGAHPELVFRENGSKFYTTDIFGVFDGQAMKDGELVYIQVKTNSFGSRKKFTEFYNESKCKNRCLVINVIQKKRKKKEVKIREYPDWKMIESYYLSTPSQAQIQFVTDGME